MFEAFMTIMNRLIACGDADCDFDDVTDREYRVTLNDWDGFDDDWCEVAREFVDPEMVKALFELLDQAEEDSDGWNVDYIFPDFSVELHYSSEDI